MTSDLFSQAKKRDILMINENELLIVTFGNRPEWSHANFRLRLDIKKALPTAKHYALDERNLMKIAPRKNQRELIKKYPNGYGLWFWKPLIILDAMKKFPNAKIILYMDTGCELNINSKSSTRLEYYLELAEHFGGLGFELDLLEKEWTSKYVLNKLKANSSTNKQIMGTIILFRNDLTSIEFIKEWNDEIEKNDYQLLIGTNNLDFEYNDKKHRHDQSILSILWHKTNFAVLPDESWPQSKSKIATQSPIISARNRLITKQTNNVILNLILRICRKLFIMLYYIFRIR